MTEPTSDESAEYTTLGPDAGRYGRYATIDLDGDVLLYDREVEDAWLQSDTAVDLDAVG